MVWVVFRHMQCILWRLPQLHAYLYHNSIPRVVQQLATLGSMQQCALAGDHTPGILPLGTGSTIMVASFCAMCCNIRRHLAPTCPLGDTPAVPAHARPASSSSAQQVPTQQQPDTMQHPHNITEAGSTGCRGADSSSSKQSNHEQLGPAGMCSVLKPGDLVTLDHLTQSAEGALQQSGKQQQFKVLEPIGWGAMGEVYKVQVPQAASKDVTGSKLASSPNSTLPASPAHPASRAKQSSDLPGQLYALKLPKPYHLASPVLQQQLPAMLYYPHVYASLGQEQQIMAQLADTDNITKCHGCGTLQYSDGMKLRALLMELAPGTLQQQLQPTPSTLAPMGAKQAWLVMRHVSGGLRDLHEAGYVYRDLKPANVLRFQYQEEDDESPYDFYKLSDFNTTVAVDQHGMVQGTGTGTFGFIAPEEYQQLEHNASSDSWSAGGFLPQIVSPCVVSTVARCLIGCVTMTLHSTIRSCHAVQFCHRA